VATVNLFTGYAVLGTTNITYTVSTGCNNPVSSFKTLQSVWNPSPGTVSGNFTDLHCEQQLIPAMEMVWCMEQHQHFCGNCDPGTGVVTAVGAGTTILFIL